MLAEVAKPPLSSFKEESRGGGVTVPTRLQVIALSTAWRSLSLKLEYEERGRFTVFFHVIGLMRKLGLKFVLFHDVQEQRFVYCLETAKQVDKRNVAICHYCFQIHQRAQSNGNTSRKSF